MAWQDRHYSRDQGASSNPLLWFLTGSVPLFTAFGIRVRMHASMVLLALLTILTSETRSGIGLLNTLTGWLILFGIILLHEFGHCFAARWVGGDANEILMWPLGGLAFADAPNRPWPQFVTAAGGPAVNVIICILTGLAEVAINWRHPYLQWNPLPGSRGAIPFPFTVDYYLWWIFTISWALFLFNLIPALPLDGGRIFQALLWFKLGFYRATMIATPVGMCASVLMAIYGLTKLGSWSGTLLVCIAISCFLYCYQLRAQLKAAGPWEFQEDEGPDYSASLWKSDEDKPKKRRLSRRAVRKLRKQQQDEEAEQARLDAILAKVSAQGMQSLTWSERRALRKATERQRRREVELSRDRAGA